MIELNMILFIIICICGFVGLIFVLIVVAYLGNYYYNQDITSYKELENKYLKTIKELRANNSMLLTDLRKERELNKFKGSDIK